MYNIRASLKDFKGLMVAQVDDATAGLIINSGKGQWQEIKLEGGVNKTAYVITEAATFTMGHRNQLCLILWEGYYLEKA